MPHIPEPSALLWDQLVTGRRTHKFTLFAANMAVSRAVRVVAGDASRKSEMIVELHQFFEKFAGLTSGDLQTLK